MFCDDKACLDSAEEDNENLKVSVRIDAIKDDNRLYVWSKDEYKNYRQRLSKRLLELEMEDERRSDIDKKIYTLTIKRDELRKSSKKLRFSFVFLLVFCLVVIFLLFLVETMATSILMAIFLFVVYDYTFELSRCVDKQKHVEISLINIEIKNLEGRRVGNK
jgi:Flp pilus assembly protein TadB